MDTASLRDRFVEEQAHIQRYVELLQYKTAIFRTELAELVRIISKYRLWTLVERLDNPLQDRICTVDELQDAHNLLQSARARVSDAIAEVDRDLATLQPPEGLNSIDARSNEGEWIEYMLEALEHDASSQHMSIVRERAVEQLHTVNEEVGDEDTVNEGIIDFAMQSAAYLLKLRKRRELQHVEDRAEEIEIAIRMLRPDTDINVLRQAFILLMTVFDATMFDLMRVALRKNFFRLIGVFGKQDKVALGSLSRYATLEEFRDHVIEEQLKARYLKDILLILENQHVQCVDQATGLKLAHIKEMVQRRNIHVHNRGCVDEKYLERDDSGTPRYNIYNLSIGSIAEIDSAYWEMSNKLTRDCVLNVAKWIDSF